MQRSRSAHVLTSRDLAVKHRRKSLLFEVSDLLILRSDIPRVILWKVPSVPLVKHPILLRNHSPFELREWLLLLSCSLRIPWCDSVMVLSS